MTGSRLTQPEKPSLMYNLNTSNPNQCWQKADIRTYRASNRFEDSEINRMKNKQRYNGSAVRSIDSNGAMNSNRSMIKSQ